MAQRERPSSLLPFSNQLEELALSAKAQRRGEEHKHSNNRIGFRHEGHEGIEGIALRMAFFVKAILKATQPTDELPDAYRVCERFGVREHIVFVASFATRNSVDNNNENSKELNVSHRVLACQGL